MLRSIYQLCLSATQGKVEIIDECLQTPQVWLQRQAGVNARGAQRHAARWAVAVAIVENFDGYICSQVARCHVYDSL